MTKAFLILLTIFCTLAPFQTDDANAQVSEPATHLWIDGYHMPVHVYVRSLQTCRMMAEQAAIIDTSVTANCYNGDEFLKQFNCRSSGASVSCSESDSPAK